MADCRILKNVPENRVGPRENQEGGHVGGCHARADPQSFAKDPSEVRRAPNSAPQRPCVPLVELSRCPSAKRGNRAQERGDAQGIPLPRGKRSGLLRTTLTVCVRAFPHFAHAAAWPARGSGNLGRHLRALQRGAASALAGLVLGATRGGFHPNLAQEGGRGGDWGWDGVVQRFAVHDAHAGANGAWCTGTECVAEA